MSTRAVVFVASFVLLGACSSSSTDAAIVDDDGGSTDDGSTAADSGKHDSGTHDAGHADSGTMDTGISETGPTFDSGLDSGGCNSIFNVGGRVVGNQVATVAPVATGGAVGNGTYVLSSETIYTGPTGTTGPLTSGEMVTVMVSSGIFESVAQGDTGPASRESGTLSTAGTAITLNTLCPASATSTATYTSTGTAFTVYTLIGTTTYSATYAIP